MDSVQRDIQNLVALLNKRPARQVVKQIMTSIMRKPTNGTNAQNGYIPTVFQTTKPPKIQRTDEEQTLGFGDGYTFAIAAVNKIRIEALVDMSTLITGIITDTTQPKWLLEKRIYDLSITEDHPVYIQPFYFTGENGATLTNTDSNSLANVNAQIESAITGAHKLTLIKGKWFRLNWENGTAYRRCRLTVDITKVLNELTEQMVKADNQDRTAPVGILGILIASKASASIAYTVQQERRYVNVPRHVETF